jgi:hypothetical protein
MELAKNYMGYTLVVSISRSSWHRIRRPLSFLKITKTATPIVENKGFLMAAQKQMSLLV